MTQVLERFDPYYACSLHAPHKDVQPRIFPYIEILQWKSHYRGEKYPDQLQKSKDVFNFLAEGEVLFYIQIVVFAPVSLLSCNLSLNERVLVPGAREEIDAQSDCHGYIEDEHPLGIGSHVEETILEPIENPEEHEGLFIESDYSAEAA